MTDFEATFGGMPFDKAIEYFKSKVALTSKEYWQLDEELRRRAFTVSGINNADLIDDILNDVENAIETGESLQAFKAKFAERAAAAGWSPAVGDVATRAALVYDTNIRTAYAAGRYAQQSDPEVVKLMPYLEYRIGDSLIHRPLHSLWDKTVLPATDNWWKTHYVPNGFN